MKKIISGDGSITFHEEDIDESYHSRSGAIEESMEKYVKPAQIKDGFKILDVCFGIGYNTVCAIHGHKRISVIGLEIDPEIIGKIPDVEVPDDLDQDYSIIKNAALMGSYSDEKREISVKLIVGDARDSVKELELESFDAVFLDPFSPKKAPEMWAVGFFRDIYLVMKPGAKLTTYSCARVVRDNLKEAGFKVMDGPCVGRRSPSTIAVRE